MKKRRMLLVVCTVLLCCLLSGCLANVGEVVINDDGSGSCTLYTGYEEEIYNEILESFQEEGMEQSEDESVPFTYNEKTYIGQVVSFDFNDIEELNDTLLQYSQQVETGVMSFAVGEGGRITFTLTTTENTGSTDTLEEQAVSSELDEETIKLLEEIVVIFDIDFPSDIKQTGGIEADGIVANENNLVIDYIKLAEELNGKTEEFTFESAENPDLISAKKEVLLADVTEDSWYYEQVSEMVEMGLIKGKGDNLFWPDDIMTKAEFITVASKLVYEKASLNLMPGNPEIWWDKYYDACVDADIFTEEELAYISMTDGMQRQEMALVAFRLVENLEGFDHIDVEEVSEKIPDFDEVGEDLQEYVAYCYSLGILCGDEQGAFNPVDTLTRAEASSVLYRIINAKARISESN